MEPVSGTAVEPVSGTAVEPVSGTAALVATAQVPIFVFPVAIATFMEVENFKATLLATSFEEWSKDKEQPNKGLGSPFVFN